MGTSEDVLAKSERWESRIGKIGGGMNLLKLTRENNRTGQLSAGKGLKQGSKRTYTAFSLEK